MTIPKFLQIHTLHSYPAALLNRTTAAWPSGCPSAALSAPAFPPSVSNGIGEFAQDEFALHSITGSASALRSRNIVERKVIEPLKEAAALTKGS